MYCSLAIDGSVIHEPYRELYAATGDTALTGTVQKARSGDDDELLTR